MRNPITVWLYFYNFNFNVKKTNMKYPYDSRIKHKVEMSRILGRKYRTNPGKKANKIKQTLLRKNNNRIIIIIENPRKYHKTLKL